MDSNDQTYNTIVKGTVNIIIFHPPAKPQDARKIKPRILLILNVNIGV